MSNEEVQKVDEVKKDDYKIVVEVRRIAGTRKDGTKYDFVVYEGYDKKGKKCEFRLTKECKGQPVKPGSYVLTIEHDKLSKDKSRRFNTFWIRDVKGYEVYDGIKTDDDDDLPF